MARLIASRKFEDARAMLGDIQACLSIAQLKWTDVVYVKTWEVDVHADTVRLFEEKLTDGSVVYELHIS